LKKKNNNNNPCPSRLPDITRSTLRLRANRSTSRNKKGTVKEEEAKEYVRKETENSSTHDGVTRQADGSSELKNEGGTILSVFERIAGRTPRDFDR